MNWIYLCSDLYSTSARFSLFPGIESRFIGSKAELFDFWLYLNKVMDQVIIAEHSSDIGKRNELTVLTSLPLCW